MSDGEHDLTIRLGMDNAPAKAASKDFAQAAREAEKEVLTDAQAAERAKVELVRATNRAKVAAAVEATTGARAAAEAQKQAAREVLAAQRASASAAAEAHRQSFATIGASIGVAQMGFAKLIQLAGFYGQAVKEAAEKSKQLTAAFTQQREDLGHLAGLQGKQADNAFTLDFARFNARTGLRPDESLASQEAFLNSGMQFRGRTISDAEHDQFREQQAGLAVARQISPGTVADLAGRMLGMKDYRKFGDRGSEQALADLNQVLAVNSSGSGEDAQLARETTKVLAAQVNEDDLRGTLKSGTEAAKLVSVLTEGFPEGQGEAANALLREMRGFGGKKKQAGILGEAKITPEDDPFEALKKLTPVLEARAKAGPKGTTVQDVIREIFEDQLGGRAIGVAINKGITGGLFAARDRTALENAGPEAAQKQIDDAALTERVRDRKADAEVRLAEGARGAENSKLQVLRKQALAELIRDKAIDVTDVNLRDKVFDQVEFLGLGEGRQRTIDKRVRDMLNRRTPKDVMDAAKAGLSSDPRNIAEHTQRTPEALAAALNRQIGAIEKGGGDPFADVRPPGAAAAPGQGMPGNAQGDGKEIVKAIEGVRERLPDPDRPKPPNPWIAPARQPLRGAPPVQDH